jgi:Tol biopolymer transport system component
VWPLFSPDGKTISFTAIGRGLFSLPLDGSSNPQMLIERANGADIFAASWSADGKWLAYLQGSPYPQILVRPVRDSKLEGEGHPFSPSMFSQWDAEFSPDGHWLAYASNESGSIEVYVQAFPGPGEKHRISSNGGINPAWSRNGRELFYLTPRTSSPSEAMMSVDLSTNSGFKAGTPQQLFDATSYPATNPLRSYDVTADGQFIMSRLHNPPDQPVTKLNVVLGWANELKRRVPSR